VGKWAGWISARNFNCITLVAHMIQEGVLQSLFFSGLACPRAFSNDWCARKGKLLRILEEARYLILLIPETWYY